MTASTDLKHFGKTSAALALLLCAACMAVPGARAADSADGAQCRALAQHMLNALVRGDSKAAAHAFDTDMRTALPPAKLSELWGEVQSNFGKYKAQRDRRAHPEGQRHQRGDHADAVHQDRTRRAGGLQRAGPDRRLLPASRQHLTSARLFEVPRMAGCHASRIS